MTIQLRRRIITAALPIAVVLVATFSASRGIADTGSPENWMIQYSPEHWTGTIELRLSEDPETESLISSEIAAIKSQDQLKDAEFLVYHFNMREKDGQGRWICLKKGSRIFEPSVKCEEEDSLVAYLVYGSGLVKLGTGETARARTIALNRSTIQPITAKPRASSGDMSLIYISDLLLSVQAHVQIRGSGQRDVLINALAPQYTERARAVAFPLTKELADSLSAWLGTPAPPLPITPPLPPEIQPEQMCEESSIRSTIVYKFADGETLTLTLPYKPREGHTIEITDTRSGGAKNNYSVTSQDANRRELRITAFSPPPPPPPRVEPWVPTVEVLDQRSRPVENADVRLNVDNKSIALQYSDGLYRAEPVQDQERLSATVVVSHPHITAERRSEPLIFTPSISKKTIKIRLSETYGFTIGPLEGTARVEVLDPQTGQLLHEQPAARVNDRIEFSSDLDNVKIQISASGYEAWVQTVNVTRIQSSIALKPIMVSLEVRPLQHGSVRGVDDGKSALVDTVKLYRNQSDDNPITLTLKGHSQATSVWVTPTGMGITRNDKPRIVASGGCYARSEVVLSMDTIDWSQKKGAKSWPVYLKYEKPTMIVAVTADQQLVNYATQALRKNVQRAMESLSESLSTQAKQWNRDGIIGRFELLLVGTRKTTIMKETLYDCDSSTLDQEWSEAAKTAFAAKIVAPDLPIDVSMSDVFDQLDAEISRLPVDASKVNVLILSSSSNLQPPPVVPPMLARVASMMVLPLRDLTEDAKTDLQRELEGLLTNALVRIEPSNIRTLLSEPDYASVFAAMIDRKLEWSEDRIRGN